MKALFTKENGRLALVLVGILILQASFASRLQVLGVTADLFLIVLVLVALTHKPLTAAVYGFFSGFAADLVFINPIGLRMLIYLAAGYLVARYAEEFEFSNAWAFVLLTALVSFLAQVVFGLFQYVTGPEASFFWMVRSQMLPAALFDALLAGPVYLGLLRLRVLRAPEQSGPSFR